MQLPDRCYHYQVIFSRSALYCCECADHGCRATDIVRRPPGVHTQQDHSETADVVKQDTFSLTEAPTQTHCTSVKNNTLGKRRAA